MLIHTSVRLPDVKSQAKNGEINKKVEHKHVFFFGIPWRARP